MSYRFRFTTIALSAPLALGLAACGGSANDEIPEPQFTAMAPSTATPPPSQSTAMDSSSSSADTTESSGSASASSSSTSQETGESESRRKASNGDVRNDDGSFRLTAAEVGPGAPAFVRGEYTGLDEAGFQILNVEVAEEGQNGVLQFPVGATLKVSVWGNDLSDDSVYQDLDFGDLSLWITDANGDVTVGEDEAEFGEVFYIAMASMGGSRDHQATEVELTTPGDQTLNMEIRQAGYEPVMIRQPIKVVE